MYGHSFILSPQLPSCRSSQSELQANLLICIPWAEDICQMSVNKINTAWLETQLQNRPMRSLPHIKNFNYSCDWMMGRWFGVRYSHDFILNVKNANWHDLVQDQQRKECNPALQLQVQQPEYCFHSIPLWTFMGCGSKPVVILEAVILEYRALNWKFSEYVQFNSPAEGGMFLLLNSLNKSYSSMKSHEQCEMERQPHAA